MARPYFSQRKYGTQPLSLDQLKTIFASIMRSCEKSGFLLEQLGINQYGKHVGGKIESVYTYLLLRLRKTDLWPIDDFLDSYSEDDLFDMIELLYDHVSSKGDFGEYDKEEAQEQFRAQVNEGLAAYGDGFELTQKGEVVSIGEDGLKELFVAPLPTEDERIKAKVDSAISRYRSRHSDSAVRREAVRDLVDVCEKLRPLIKKSMMLKDEDGLFEIANNYAIRHHKDNQKTEYGSEWLSWMFYLYLSTIHLCLRIANREKAAQAAAPDFPE